MIRRDFLRTLGATTLAASPLAGFSLATRDAFAAAANPADLVIQEVDVLRLVGPHQSVRGVNRQPQVQPGHLYPERRPPAYKDAANAKPETTPLTQHYVRIRTKGGHEGLYGMVDPEVLPVLLGPLRKLLLGQDALAIERCWDQMYRSNRHSRASHYMMAISALDNALWDLRGRLFGAPVYRLLGGPTQQPVPVYASCLGFSVEPALAARRAAQLEKDGFRMQKWFIGYGPGDGAKGMDLNVALVRALREAVGEDTQIMFDAYQGWDLQYALEWCQKVERYRPAWLEEPFPVADLESFERLSRATGIPLATGEHFYNRWEVEQYLKAGSLNYVQADPEWCGGLSEVLKIIHLCSAHGVKLIPHCHNVHAALHLVASQSPAVCPYGEYLLNHVPEKLHFMKDPPLTTNGWVTLRDRPGFGIELDPAKIERQEVLTQV
ncbi:MAG TPA: enolase C-terminal domain-like protein [Polyangiaceae bacterium]|nr:enolase C-terminal domain-like protein [Polyangiaceae bacterium]